MNGFVLFLFPLTLFFSAEWTLSLLLTFVIYLLFLFKAYPNDMRINGFLMNCQMCICLFSKWGLLFFCSLVSAFYFLKTIGQVLFGRVVSAHRFTEQKNSSILTNLIGIFRFLSLCLFVSLLQWALFMPLKYAFLQQISDVGGFDVGEKHLICNNE